MKNTTLGIIALVTVLGAAATVPVIAQERSDRRAQAHQGGGHHGGARHQNRRGAGMRALLENYDSDADGTLTQDELNAGRLAQLTEFDTDGNGTLTLEEYQALWLDAMRERMVDRFQSHDDDGSGEITFEEFNERFANMIARMDRNEDGALSEEDRRRRNGRPGAQEEQSE